MNRRDLDQIEDLATDWLVRRQGGLSTAEEAELQAWLDSDPRHLAAFAEAELALSVLAPPLTSSQREQLRRELATPSKPRLSRRLVAFTGLGFAAAAALLFAFLPRSPAPEPTAFIARPLEQTLPDGTKVQLNAGAEITHDFSGATRKVVLVQGEAHFDVAKDPAHPFIVAVGPVRVRAVGTAFNIRYAPTSVEVLVTEGQVRVSEPMTAVSAAPAPTTPARETDLSAGHRTVIPLVAAMDNLDVMSVSPSDIQRDLAWREMRFELSNATLAEAVELFNRKGGVQLELADNSLRSLRISGIYWANNPEQFAELVSTTLGLEYRRRGDRIVFAKQ
jgi:transmembrane sensor